MSEVKKINVGPALTTPLALARRGGQIATEQYQKHSEKVSTVKGQVSEKMAKQAEILWTVLGLVLILHGAQFKNLFLCTQVVVTFCYDRIKGSVLSLVNDVTAAWSKTDEGAEPDDTKADAKAEAKQENKHAQKRAAKKDEAKNAPSQAQREEDAAATKKVLKSLDSDKVTSVLFELCVSFVGCHMVMEGGLAKVAVVTHALVKASKEKISGFLDHGEHADMQAWADLLLNFLLYVIFGGMALLAPSLAFALNVAICGAQLVTAHGLRVAEGMGKIPGGVSAEAFAASINGLAVLGGLTAFGTLWQFWALVADSGMGWYFKILYLPAYFAECVVSLF